MLTVLIAFAALFACGSIRASSDEGSLSVRLVDQGGSRLGESSFVRAGDIRAFIDIEGVAQFPSLRAGEYAVEVESPGFKACYPLKARVVPGEETTVVLWMQSESWAGPFAFCLIPPLLETSVEVIEPAGRTRIAVGTPIRIAWRVVNGPPDPTGWEVQVALDGVPEGKSVQVIGAFPLDPQRSSFIWKPDQGDVDWLRECSAEDFCSYPIEVALYNAAARGQAVGVRQHFDEMLAFLHLGRGYPTYGAYILGSTYYNDGRVQVKPRAAAY